MTSLMAVSISTNLTRPLFFTLLLILVFLSSSSARLLTNDFIPRSLPALNLALPRENPVAVAAAGLSSEKEMGRKVVLPCNMGFQPLILGGRKKYGALVLNMLPKGPVPSSGPSKRINDIKN